MTAQRGLLRDDLGVVGGVGGGGHRGDQGVQVGLHRSEQLAAALQLGRDRDGVGWLAAAMNRGWSRRRSGVRGGRTRRRRGPSTSTTSAMASLLSSMPQDGLLGGEVLGGWRSNDVLVGGAAKGRGAGMVAGLTGSAVIARSSRVRMASYEPWKPGGQAGSITSPGASVRAHGLRKPGAAGSRRHRTCGGPATRRASACGARCWVDGRGRRGAATDPGPGVADLVGQTGPLGLAVVVGGSGRPVVVGDQAAGADLGGEPALGLRCRAVPAAGCGAPLRAALTDRDCGVQSGREGGPARAVVASPTTLQLPVCKRYVDTRGGR
jgi:hypothetical protein